MRVVHMYVLLQRPYSPSFGLFCAAFAWARVGYVATFKNRVITSKHFQLEIREGFRKKNSRKRKYPYQCCQLRGQPAHQAANSSN